MGQSPERIVSITFLAQAIMAVGLSQPNNSRARPSAPFKKDDDYQRIFSDKIDLAVYLWAAKTQKSVDAFLRSDEAHVTASERTNFRFHLAMLAAAKLFGGQVYAPGQLSNIAGEDRQVSQADMAGALAELRSYLFRIFDGD